MSLHSEGFASIWTVQETARGQVEVKDVVQLQVARSCAGRASEVGRDIFSATKGQALMDVACSVTHGNCTTEQGFRLYTALCSRSF